MQEPKLVCLLPVRNGAADLPGYLDSVSRFADTVVALDDGSTDETRARLEADRRVARVLSNPRRETYVGWDDAENRRRLLDAAGMLRPEWVMFLDADERVSPDDAEALRRFVESEALPGVAYGFRVHRMIESLERYDRAALWVYRLFAYQPGQTLPPTKLHLVPIPVQIPRERWIKTTIRIQHLSSLDAVRREARYRKYQEADPGCEYQKDYRHLLDPPRACKAWEPRAPGLPVVKEGARHRRLAFQLAASAARAAEDEASRPALSAVVIAQNDRDRIEAVMDALVHQEVSEPVEIILVDSGSDGTAEFVRERYPTVRVVYLSEPALPGRARNAGLQVARGRIVSFPGSHVVLEPGALQQRIDAHRLGYVMVTGSVLNGTRTLSGWASYFLDHSEALPDRPSGALAGPPSHCSYLAEALIEAGGFPEDRRVGEDTLVNRALFARGHKAGRSATIRFVHRSPCRAPGRLLRHHFERGSGFGRILWERAGAPSRLRARLPALAWLAGRYPFARLRFVTHNVWRWGGALRLRYALCFPLVVAGTLAAALGAFRFVLRAPRARPSGALRPQVRSGRARLPASSAASLGVGVPTLFYLATREYAEAMSAYVMRFGGAPGSRMAFLYYEDLPRLTELPAGTYLFADLERLRPRQLELAARVWEQLAKEPARARALNDPRRALRRYDLLARLHAEGINRFRSLRASEPLEALRFPVFLRAECEHTGALTPLLPDERTLRRALRRARLRGYRATDLLVTEFCDTSDERGVFRKYSAFRVGDEILPRHVLFSRRWHVKQPDLEDGEFAREREAYLAENPHEDRLREIFELAGIEYGRVDYGLRDGEIQVWEINTNPTVRRLTVRLSLALEALDCIPDSQDPIPIHVAPELLAAVEREERALRRTSAWRHATEMLRLQGARGNLRAIGQGLFRYAP